MRNDFSCPDGCRHSRNGVCRLAVSNVHERCPVERAPEVRALIARMGPVEGWAERTLKNRMGRKGRRRR